MKTDAVNKVNIKTFIIISFVLSQPVNVEQKSMAQVTQPHPQVPLTTVNQCGYIKNGISEYQPLA